MTRFIYYLPKKIKFDPFPKQSLLQAEHFVNSLENQWTTPEYLLGKPMDHVHGKSHGYLGNPRILDIPMAFSIGNPMGC